MSCCLSRKFPDSSTPVCSSYETRNVRGVAAYDQWLAMRRTYIYVFLFFFFIYDVYFKCIHFVCLHVSHDVLIYASVQNVIYMVRYLASYIYVSDYLFWIILYYELV